jgi:cytidylate kinase
VAAHGPAVILGRGAGFILKRESCLRVLLMAPLKDRVQAEAARQGMSLLEARRRLLGAQAQRCAFIRRYFHADMLDLTYYDLALNTAALGQEVVVSLILAAWEGRRARVRAPLSVA